MDHVQPMDVRRVHGLPRIVVFVCSAVFVGMFLSPFPAHAQAAYCVPGTVQRSVIENGVRKDVPVQVLVADPASECAQRASGGYFIKDPNCKCCGSCELNDFVALGIEVTQFIFGIVGALALIMFIIGGFFWLSAAGSADRVKRGRETMVHAVIGLVIVFGAWVLVNTILAALTGQTATGAVQIFSGDWATVWSISK